MGDITSQELTLANNPGDQIRTTTGRKYKAAASAVLLRDICWVLLFG